MTITENIMIGVGLSMDALMISFSKGYSWKKRQLLILSLFFGLFQCIMTYIGYHFGSYFIPKELPYKNIFIFLILTYIGIKMIQEKTTNISNFNITTVFFYSIITSIDAFSIGISQSIYHKSITIISIIIGITTLMISFIGSIIGYLFQNIKLKGTNKLGGIIIIIYAIKILLVR